MFGNLTVKEKIRAILKQNGRFICPNQPVHPQPNPVKQRPATTPAPKAANGRYEVG